MIAGWIRLNFFDQIVDNWGSLRTEGEVVSDGVIDGAATLSVMRSRGKTSMTLYTDGYKRAKRPIEGRIGIKDKWCGSGQDEYNVWASCTSCASPTRLTLWHRLIASARTSSEAVHMDYFRHRFEVTCNIPSPVKCQSQGRTRRCKLPIICFVRHKK